MANILEIVSEKVQGWIGCWGAVTLTPQRFFKPGRRPYAISTFEFFVGNHLLAYLLLFTGSIGYFALYYRERLLTHTAAKEASSSLATSATLFAIFVLLSFVSMFVAATITFMVAKLFRSPAEFNKHVNSFMYLSAIEPLGTFGLAICLLAASSTNIRGIPEFALWTGLAIAALARVWALVAGFFAVSFVHPLPRARRIALYVCGFLPGFIILNTFVLGIVSLLLTMVLIPNWD